MQSLAALDKPLGQKQPREPRAPKAATTAPTLVGAKAEVVTSAPKEKPAPKEVDPAVATRLAEEEEKKRKRAERFGPQASAVSVLPSLSALGCASIRANPRAWTPYLTSIYCRISTGAPC